MDWVYEAEGGGDGGWCTEKLQREESGAWVQLEVLLPMRERERGLCAV